MQANAVTHLVLTTLLTTILLAASCSQDELSVEVSLSEIRRVAQAMGFVLKHEETVDAGASCVT